MKISLDPFPVFEICFLFKKNDRKSWFYTPEHGDEKVDQHNVGEEQVDDQEDDHQPVSISV